MLACRKESSFIDKNIPRDENLTCRRPKASVGFGSIIETQ
jgi:hypothetical protein